MGFLSNLVADMVGESVGFDARKLSRMVGGKKNLLMVGAGAALAGGLASALNQNQGETGGVSPSMMTGQPAAAPPPPPGVAPPPPPGATAAAPPAPPLGATAAAPPPPPPPAAVAPPPPPPPAAGDTETADSEDFELGPEMTYAVVRAMVAAALADGHLDPKEKDVIERRLGESGLSPGETQQIHRDLVLPPSPAEIAALAGTGEAREMIYRFAALVLLADQEVSDLERAWLERLARAFEIDAERVAALEKEIFA